MLSIPDVECLHCKHKGKCVTFPDEIITTSENIIVRPILCQICQQKWKDFYGANNEISPVISIQRNTNSNNN